MSPIRGEYRVRLRSIPVGFKSDDEGGNGGGSKISIKLMTSIMNDPKLINACSYFKKLSVQKNKKVPMICSKNGSGITINKRISVYKPVDFTFGFHPLFDHLSIGLVFESEHCQIICS